MSRARPLLVCLLVVSCFGVASAAAAPAAPTIVEVYPNTVHADNAGEYVVVEFAPGSDLSAFSLTDGKTTTPLGNGTVSGSVAFSRAPEITREKVSAPVYELPEHFAMAQTGETIRLVRRGEPVDETTYERAPEGERWLLADGGWEWRHRGATDFEARDLPAERATAFVLPDLPEVPTPSERPTSASTSRGTPFTPSARPRRSLRPTNGASRCACWSTAHPSADRPRPRRGRSIGSSRVGSRFGSSTARRPGTGFTTRNTRSSTTAHS
ncbi:hypothetical protein HAPAU_21770 [Halalkalicoccus paucihalophilus]|uniref:Uncharacterized protein n=1 Tax=Halalkalicoccus paucihalophilus TaxID=1008153 RepID=A0A151ACZ4_9EURY|nr:hypothetical protein HAPAU_21770 [Halalkalicoccus paucihalophilus]